MGELKENIVVGQKHKGVQPISVGKMVKALFMGERRKKKPVKDTRSVMDRVMSDDGMIRDI